MGSEGTEATFGSLKIPAPKSFSGKGQESDPFEYENFSRQMKAYLSIQSPRFEELMIAAEQSPTEVGMPSNEDDKKLARILQNVLILT